MYFKYIIIAFIVLASNQVNARQSCDWPFRTTITIQQSDFDGLTDYPVDLVLNSSNLHGGYDWTASGADLRIFDADDTTPLNFNIARWNQAGQSSEVRVSLPNLNRGTRTIYLYYGNNSVSSQSTTVPSLPYTEDKIRFHTRSNLSIDPDTVEEARSIFNQGNDTNDDYGCSHPDVFTNITNQNQGTGRISENFIAVSTTKFTVESAGYWGIRYGADFGLGGGLYIDKVHTLEEIWDPLNDFWWAGNWNSDYVLDGSIYLTAGEHELEIIGAEQCCDGGVTVEFSRNYQANGDYNTATWLPFTSDNIDIRSEACPIPSLTVSYGSHDVCSIDLSLDTTTAIASEWIVGSSNDIPLQVTLESSDPAGQTAQAPTSIEVVLPSDVSLTGDFYTGINWDCTGTTGTIQCNYSATLTNSNALSSVLTLHTIVDPSATAGSSISISAAVSGQNIDLNDTNDSINQSILLGTNAGLDPSCSSPQPGVWARYFDSSGSLNVSSAADFNTLLSNYKTANHLSGQTILTGIDNAGNPFYNASSPDGYLVVLEGYIFMDTPSSYEFNVRNNGGDETLIDGDLVSSYYHGAPKFRSSKTLSAGFNKIEYRHQGATNNTQYRLRWRLNGTGPYAVIPTDLFYHCAGDTNIDINASVNVESDDINGSALAKAIPNAIIKHTVTGTNKGNISTDNGSTILTIAIDSGSELFVKDLNGAGEGPIHFIDGSSTDASGLSYNYNAIDGLGDSLWFSTGGSTFIESTDLTNDYNAAITHFQIRFDGSLKASINTAEPRFIFEYQVRIK